MIQQWSMIASLSTEAILARSTKLQTSSNWLTKHLLASSLCNFLRTAISLNTLSCLISSLSSVLILAFNSTITSLLRLSKCSSPPRSPNTLISSLVFLTLRRSSSNWSSNKIRYHILRTPRAIKKRRSSWEMSRGRKKRLSGTLRASISNTRVSRLRRTRKKSQRRQRKRGINHGKQSKSIRIGMRLYRTSTLKSKETSPKTASKKKNSLIRLGWLTGSKTK